jgi:hypothetical protein
MQKRKDGVIMNRKFLAKVLAASLVLTATPALPGAEADAASQKTGGGYLSLVKSNRGAAENADSETLTGTAWWDGSQKGKDYILSGAGTLDLYVTFDSTADSNGYGAFSVELLSDGNKYITTNSNYDAWVNGCTGTITGALKEQASTIVVGHVYKISVKRTDNDFSVVYYDLTDDKEYCSMEITGTDHATDVNIHIIAQVGTYIVSQTAPTIKPDEPGTEDPKPDNPGTEDPKPDEPGTEDPKPDNPGTDTPGDTENSVTFEGWWTKHLDGEKVTEDGITLKFKAKSNGSLRYEVPVYAVFSSDDGKVGKAETNGYAEYGVMRSDYNGWGEVKYWGQGATTYNPTAAETEEAVKDWTPTQKEFNDYIVEAYKEGTNVYMKITAGTLVTFAKFTVPAEKDVYLALTGENCTVENYTCSASESKFTDANEPADIVLGPDKLDCKGYRMAFSGGNEITSDGVAVTFNSKTYADANFNWNSPALVVYEAEVPAEHNVSDTVFKATAGYSELLYARADNWGYALGNDNDEYRINCSKWSEEGYNWVARGLPNWDLFREANKAGVPCEASAVYKDGKILVKLSVNGVTNLISFPYEKKEGKNVYFSLTGEMCTLSDIATSTFTGITIPSGIATYPVILPTPTPAPTLPPVDENATPAPTPLLEPETLTGTAWWDGSQKGRDYTLSGQGTLDLYVTFDSTTDSNGYGAFNVELLSDGNKYITTGSDDNAWVAEEGTGTVVDAANTGSTIVAGHVYKISVKRTGYDFSVVYYDLTDNKEYCSMEIKNTNQAIDVNVHIIAQVGKFIVSQSAPDVVTPPTTATPAPSTDPAATPEPGITPAPGATATPGTTPDPGTTVDPGTQTPGTTDTPEEPSKEDNKKKTMKVSDITAKTGKKKVTGNLSVKGTKVQVKVGNKKYKNAKVNGKKFTFTVSSKLKKGTKITIKVTKSGYKTVTKTVKVK